MKKSIILPTIGKLLLASTLLFSVSCANETIEELDSNEALVSVSSNELHSARTPVHNGVYYIQNVGSGKYLDISGPATTNGRNAHQWQYLGTSSQRWKYTEVGDDRRLVNVYSGKTLEVSNFSEINGGNVQQWEWTATDSQKWALDPIRDNQFEIVNQESKLRLEVGGYKTGNGGNIQQWADANHSFQRWLFRPE